MTKYLRDEELGFIPLDEWEARNGKRQLRKAPMVMGDIEPFVSPIDGSVITTRPKLAEHNQKHGVTNINDYGAGHFEKRGKEMAAEASGQTAEAKQERKQLIDKTLTNFGV